MVLLFKNPLYPKIYAGNSDKRTEELSYFETPGNMWPTHERIRPFSPYQKHMDQFIREVPEYGAQFDKIRKHTVYTKWFTIAYCTGFAVSIWKKTFQPITGAASLFVTVLPAMTLGYFLLSFPLGTNAMDTKEVKRAYEVWLFYKLRNDRLRKQGQLLFANDPAKRPPRIRTDEELEQAVQRFLNVKAH